MKQINKLSVRIVVALLIGFLFAGALTKITYPCEPTDGAKGSPRVLQPFQLELLLFLAC